MFEFLVAIQLSSDFFKVQISAILNSSSFPFALVRPVTNLPVVREITIIKKRYKIMLYRVHLAMKRVRTYNFMLSNRVENRKVIAYWWTVCMLHVRERKFVMLPWSQKTVAIFINMNNFKIRKDFIRSHKSKYI